MGAIWSNGTAKTSCSTKATRSAGEPIEDDEHREPDRIAQQDFLLGIDSLGGTHDASGTWVSSDDSRRVPGPRVERDPPDHRCQPGPKVVEHTLVSVAQADPRLDGVVRLTDGAEHPEGDAPQWERLASKRSASQSWSFAGRRPAVGSVIALTRAPASMTAGQGRAGQPRPAARADGDSVVRTSRQPGSERVGLAGLAVFAAEESAMAAGERDRRRRAARPRRTRRGWRASPSDSAPTPMTHPGRGRPERGEVEPGSGRPCSARAGHRSASRRRRSATRTSPVATGWSGVGPDRTLVTHDGDELGHPGTGPAPEVGLVDVAARRKGRFATGEGPGRRWPRAPRASGPAPGELATRGERVPAPPLRWRRGPPVRDHRRHQPMQVVRVLIRRRSGRGRSSRCAPPRGS